MIALYKISTNTVIQQWESMPNYFSIPEELISVHSPSEDWSCGDYKLIRASYKRRAQPHKFAEVLGSTEKVVLVNGEPHLEISQDFTNPSLEEVMGRLYEEIEIVAKNFQTVSNMEVLTYLEAMEVLEDKTPSNDEYPLVAMLIETEEGVENLIDAALFVIAKFKNIRKTMAHAEITRLRLYDEVKMAKTIPEAINIVQTAIWHKKEDE